MDPRLLSLYEQELRYFRESSAEFAQAFPKIAHRLGLDGQEDQTAGLRATVA